MPSFKDFYGGRFLKASDIPDTSPPVKVLDVQPLEIEQEDGEIRTKLVAKLDGLAKPIALNATNAKRLAAVLGDDYEQWAGALVTIRRVKVSFQGAEVDSIGITEVVKG